MRPEIAPKMNDITELCLKYQIRRLEVFGSAAREYDFKPENSDFDFIVDDIPLDGPGTLKRVMGFRRELASVIGRRINVMDQGAKLNRYFMASVNRDRKTVYAT